MAGREAIAGLIEDPAGKKRNRSLGTAPVAPDERSTFRRGGSELTLNAIPDFRLDQRFVLAGIGFGVMTDASGIDRVGQDVRPVPV